MKRKRLKFLIAGLTIGLVAIVIYFTFPYIFGSTAYPLEYKELIAKYSSQYNLDPNWVAAVIYAESRFNPNARSHAGASGLMQIMPSTGAGIAKKLGVTNFKNQDLFNPETSIWFGTYYLRYFLDSYGNDKTLAEIGYNGGGRAVNSFKSRQVIPRETSGYIRIIPAAENVYNSLYGEWWKSIPEGANIIITSNSSSTVSNSAGPQDSDFVKPEKKSLSVKDFWRALLFAGRYNKEE